VLVGSSYGGAIAVALLQRGHGAADAAARAGGARAASPRGCPRRHVWLVHGRATRSSIVEDSRVLARSGRADACGLLEVDDVHALHTTVEDGGSWRGSRRSRTEPTKTSAKRKRRVHTCRHGGHGRIMLGA
jgi:hypothetical protein